MSEPRYRHLRTQNDQDVLVLTVAEPELRTADVTAAVLRELTTAVEAAGTAKVVLNLGKVRVLTSAGTSALVAFRRYVTQRGGFVLLCQVNPEVANVLFAAPPSGSGSSSKIPGSASSSKIPFGLAPDVASAVAYLTGAGWGSYQLHAVEVGQEP